MKLIITNKQDELIYKVLVLAEALAFGACEQLITEYKTQYGLDRSFNLGSFSKELKVFPDKISKVRYLRKLLDMDESLDSDSLILLSTILQAYFLLGCGKFIDSLDDFLDIGHGISWSPSNMILNEKNTLLENYTDMPHDFLLAYEISKKIFRDLAWINNPEGGVSSLYEMPIRYTKESFIEIL